MSSRAAPALRLGAVLLQQGVVTLAAAERGARRAADDRPATRRAAADARTRAAARSCCARLSAQNGISYLATVDPASVRTAPGGLSADEVRALGIVPFRETDEELLVACAAPVPHSALGALQALIGPDGRAVSRGRRRLRACWRAEYGASATGLARDDDGPRHLARARRGSPRSRPRRGDVTVTEAHVDPFTWVRIAANGRISTLLVPPYPQQIEGERRMAGGYYTALSGMRTRMDALDRLASDIANASTAGYKTERAGTTQADRPSFGATLQSAVDVANGEARIGSPARARWRRPAVRSTWRFEGRASSSVQTPQGERYTRNGHLVRRADGTLSTDEGDAVLGADGPIKIGTGDGRRRSDGTVRNGGRHCRQAEGRRLRPRRRSWSATAARGSAPTATPIGRREARRSCPARSSSRTSRSSSASPS